MSAQKADTSVPFAENPRLKGTTEGDTLAHYDEQSTREWLGGKVAPKDGRLIVYRATSDGSAIKPGDYITNDKQYALDHIKNNLGGEGKVVELQIALNEMLPADAPKEFWYRPASPSIPKENNIHIPTFIDKVESELLPLKRGTNPSARYESVNLPDELRGPVAGYKEHIYNSPIKTSAGDVHFSNVGNSMLKSTPDSYFAHTRIEDLPGKERGMPKDYEIESDNVVGHGNKYYSGNGDTRRVIEIQSDLFQKGRLEGEKRTAGLGFQADIGRFTEKPEIMATRMKKQGYSSKEIERAVEDYTQARNEFRAKLPKDLESQLQAKFKEIPVSDIKAYIENCL